MTVYSRRKAVAGLIGASLLPAAARAASEAAAPRRGGTLHMSINAVPPSASIQEETVVVALQAFMPVFNNLVMFDQSKRQTNPDTIVPDLATEWRWSEDNTLLTFQLRRGVTWHDGRPFTSADVKATWDAVSRKRQSGWRRSPRAAQFGNIAEVRTDGDFAASFKLERPQASFLTLLATGWSAVYPAHVDGATMRRRPVGTGPFRVAEFNTNVVKLARNPTYWKEGRPFLDAIETTVITSPSTLSLAFATGRLDIASINVPALAELQAQLPTARYTVNMINSHFHLLINRSRPPFDDPRVRQAVNLTLDRAEYVKTAGVGYGRIGGAMLPPPEGFWGLPPEELAKLPGYGTDIAASRVTARELLQAAGFGATNPLKVQLVARNLTSARLPTIILTEQLRQIGIEAEIRLVETAQFNAVQASGNWPLLITSYGASADDPDTVLYDGFACGSPGNFTNYCTPDMQARIEAQSAMLDPVRRRAMVQEIDRLLQEDIARPVLMHNPLCFAEQAYVRGYVSAENGLYSHWRMEDVWLDR